MFKSRRVLRELKRRLTEQISINEKGIQYNEFYEIDDRQCKIVNKVYRSILELIDDLEN